MNEQIKKLAAKANFGHIENGEVVYDHRLEKFAELIVLKCAEIADTAEPFLASDLIKEYFGIEEPKGWICPKCSADRTKIACPLGFGATVDGRCPMTVEAQ
jgi:hypothetical protein